MSKKTLGQIAFEEYWKSDLYGSRIGASPVAEDWERAAQAVADAEWEHRRHEYEEASRNAALAAREEIAAEEREKWVQKFALMALSADGQMYIATNEKDRIGAEARAEALSNVVDALRAGGIMVRCFFCGMRENGAYVQETVDAAVSRQRALIEQLTRALLAADIGNKDVGKTYPGCRCNLCLVDAALTAVGLITQEQRDAKGREFNP